jgi:SAM-dependent methyltransferase
MHDSAYLDAQRFVERYLSNRDVLRVADIGSFDVNGTLRALFDRPGWTYRGLDRVGGPNVDHVLSGDEAWPEVPDASFDVVASSQRLEHVRKPWSWMSELARICVPDGLVYVCSPNTWDYHPYPIDCWRIWPDGLKGLFEEAGLVPLEVYANGNDTSGIGTKRRAATPSEVPKITVLCLTTGRETLPRTLKSLQRQQWRPNDEVRLVCDGPINEFVQQTWLEARLPGRLQFLETGPHHDWGHTPRNIVVPQIDSGYIVNLDDDDVLTPPALSVVRDAIKRYPRAFFMFRAAFPEGHTPWIDEVVREGNVGTGLFVHPAGIEFGEYTNRHEGDFDFIVETLFKNKDRQLVWCQEATYLVRPHQRVINPHFQDISKHAEGRGREDCQSGWHTFFGRWFQSKKILDVGAGFAQSKPRLEVGGNTVVTHDRVAGLPVDITGSLSALADESFDIVTAFDVVEHVPDPDAFVTELGRLARTAVVMTTPNLWVHHCQNPHHIREFSPTALLDLAWSIPGAMDVQTFASQRMDGVHSTALLPSEFLSTQLSVLAVVIWKTPTIAPPPVVPANQLRPDFSAIH